MLITRWKSLSLVVALVLTFVNCSGGSGQEESLEQVIPSIPANTDFGPLYPRLNALLNSENPDVHGAVRVAREWAEKNIPNFGEGGCARTQVVYDGDFTQRYNPFTLAVTYPWMQIYIRDGQRGEDNFIWSDASLFIGTVLHEYVHAMQRARQSRQYLVASDDSCQVARNALSSKVGVWNTGFSQLRNSRTLGDAYDENDKALLYRWISPIERARDEVEAATLTVRWMAQFPDELNLMTTGGATNWIYGAQYLDLLRTLASSNCFSGDDGTFAEENHIFNVEIPAFAKELEQHEEAMTHFLNQQGREPAIKDKIAQLVVPPAPRGRDGHACVGLDRQLPRYPFSRMRDRNSTPDRAPAKTNIGCSPLPGFDQ